MVGFVWITNAPAWIEAPSSTSATSKICTVTTVRQRNYQNFHAQMVELPMSLEKPQQQDASVVNGILSCNPTASPEKMLFHRQTRTLIMIFHTLLQQGQRIDYARLITPARAGEANECSHVEKPQEMSQGRTAILR